MPIKLSADETAKRFGVRKAIVNFPAGLTAQEEANIKVVLEYMEVCLSSRRIPMGLAPMQCILNR